MNARKVLVKLVYSHYTMGSQSSRAKAVLVTALIVCALFSAFSLTLGNHEHSVSHACVFCHLGHCSYASAAEAPLILPPSTRPTSILLEQARHAVKQAAQTVSGRAPPTSSFC